MPQTNEREGEKKTSAHKHQSVAKNVQLVILPKYKNFTLSLCFFFAAFGLRRFVFLVDLSSNFMSHGHELIAKCESIYH